jgi:hypothetical protein
MSREVHLYRHFDAGGALLYVGVSRQLKGRINGHRYNSVWFGDVEKTTIEKFSCRRDALAAEGAAIRNEKPKFNINASLGEETTRIVFRLPSSLVKRLRVEAARRDERTLSSLVRKVLLEFSPEPQTVKRRKAPYGWTSK